MKYGKIKIEGGMIHFTAHRRSGTISCLEIVWAYHKREHEGERTFDRQLVSNYLVVVTRKSREFQFAMSEREVYECLNLLRALNPEIAVTYPESSRKLFQNLTNTRDLGGIETIEGKRILPCRILRGGELYHASGTDRQMLESDYRLRTVIDLRSSSERHLRPDDVIPNCEYFHIPLLDESSFNYFQEGNLTDQITSIEGDPQTYLKEQYLHMIHDPYTVGQIARVLEIIRANQSGAVLVHDGMGKDRVDMVIMFFLSILGVPRESIRAEYMKSNAALAPEKQYALELMASRGFEKRILENRIRSIYEVKVNYLDAVFYSIEAEYGSVSHFLKRGLYITPKASDDLREKYLI